MQYVQHRVRIAAYLEIIGSLQTGQAMKLTPSLGETIATVRRRLGAGARSAKKELVIEHSGDDIYFWEK